MKEARRLAVDHHATSATEFVADKSAQRTSIVALYRPIRSRISSVFRRKYSYGNVATAFASAAFCDCGALKPSISVVVLVKSTRDCSSSVRRVVSSRASVWRREVTVDASCKARRASASALLPKQARRDAPPSTAQTSAGSAQPRFPSPSPLARLQADIVAG